MRKIQEMLADLKERQKNGEYTLCPRCGRNTMKPELYTNALSRLADIMVCDECGMDEAKLAYMRNPGTIYTWKALQPNRPANDFKALNGSAVWKHIQEEQCETIFKLYDEYRKGTDRLEIQFEAFESLPGLTSFGTEPFHLRYRAKDGVVLIRMTEEENGPVIIGNLLGK